MKERRTIRLQGYDYSKAGSYFVTICVHDRMNLCGFVAVGADPCVGPQMMLNKFGEVVQETWRNLPNRYPNVLLDAFVVMPNHFHGILRLIHHDDNQSNVGAIHELPLRLKRRAMLLPKIVGFFKMNSAKSINQIRNVSGKPVWQRNYYEHVIRNEQELNEMRRYIEENPLKWDLDPENMMVTA